MATKNSRKAILPDLNIVEEDLFTFGLRSMMTYSKAVNEERSVPDLYDGLKPVMRRILWSTYTGTTKGAQVKSAKTVGHCMGTYHPHGDVGIYGAMVTMVNAEIPPYYGVGNWGTLTDMPAAMRYTELKLSKYGESFLDKDYLDVTPMVNNYDRTTTEPLSLPALLPALFLNQNSGIGVGLTTDIPSFVADDLFAVCAKMLRGEAVDEDYLVKNLRFNYAWGGKTTNTRSNKLAIKEFFETGRGTVQWDTPIIEDREKKVLRINAFAPSLDVESLMEKIRLIPQVLRTDMDKGMSFSITIKPSTNYVEFDAVREKIKKMAQKKTSFRLNVTMRKPLPGGDDYEVNFMQGGILEILILWLKYRVRLEAKCLDLLIIKRQKDIDYTNLLIKAVDNLDVIFKGLRSAAPAEYIAKGMAITVDEANQILELKVRQLTKLDQDALKVKLKAQTADLKVLNNKRKKPALTVAEFFDNLTTVVHDKRWPAQHQAYVTEGI